MADPNHRRALLSWIYVCPLFVLCAILGVIQYRLIDQVRDAASQRMHGALQASLVRVSQEVDAEIGTAAASVAPGFNVADPAAAERDLQAGYDRWKQTARHPQLFAHVALAVPEGTVLRLHSVEPPDADWTPSLLPLRTRLEARLRGEAPPMPGLRHDDEGTAMEMPIFPPPTGDSFARREMGWVIFEVNAPYVRSVLLPEVLQRQLGAGGMQDYNIRIVNRSDASQVVFLSGGAAAGGAVTADATVTLFDPQYAQLVRRSVRGPAPPPSRVASSDSGRWLMSVQHRAGSLEAVAGRARLLNLAVTAGVLLLMLATLAALIRYTRRAQKLAELQIEFVAGVSHELRTPLTVIYTAAYNLRGKLANNPAQVERYGELIQRESGRLKELVENVLQFAGAKAGRVIQDRQPLALDGIIDQAVESSKTLIAGAQCVVEKSIDAELPLVMGDAVALRQALANLVSNAAKYGAAEGQWIGISARQTGANGDRAVEIRVSDRGPGIPANEQAHIFDAFFRGARAVQDQIHGTGLGLSLVKRIVEAHGGSVRVKSAPAKGAEFVVTIPAMPNGESA